MALMDEIDQQIAQMSEDDIRKELARVKENRAKQAERNKEKLKTLTPEQKAERVAKQKAYREQHGDKFKAARDAYNKRPEVVEKRKAYMKLRNDKQRAIIARAKELGITV